MARQHIPESVKRQVLIESGYRCAVPTCRNILAIDLHHIIEVKDNGASDPSNLLALCPTCHALYTRGEIGKEAISAWKTMLVGLNSAFDRESITNLLFLKKLSENVLCISGDGVLKFSHLIASGWVSFVIKMQNGPLLLYEVRLTDKGNRIIDAWFGGNREDVKNALYDLTS